MRLDAATALDLSARIAACGSLVAGLEMFSVRHEFLGRGVFSVRGVATLYSRGTGALTSAPPAINVMLTSLVLSSAALAILGPFGPVGSVALTLCFASRSLVRWRRLLAGDGAEQLISLILAATLLAVLPWPSQARLSLAVWFISSQLMLSYVTAGIAKLRSPVWRQGEALAGILSTEVHGHPVAAAGLRQFGIASKAAGWGVMIFECAFPLLFFGPQWMAVAALAVGLVFHVACAATMGLNNFLWAFPATYPCMYCAAQWMSPWW